MNWFYESAGQQQGPVSDSELDRLLSEGKINATTLVWHDGMADWKPMSEARPGVSIPPPVTGGISLEGQPGPGFVRCSLTGKIIPEAEAVFIQGKPYSAEAKPAVLQSVQQSGSVPVLAGDRTGPPWEHRAELGFFPSAWGTIQGVLTKPSETFGTMKREGGLSSPLLFYVIFGSIGMITALLYQYLTTRATGAAAPPAGSFEALVASWMAPPRIYIIALVVPVFISLNGFLGAGLTHLSLMIFGGAKQPYETTFRVHAFAHGSSTFLSVIPVCGGLVGAIWGIVATCIGIAKAHEISTGRAVLAVLAPLLICCVFGFFGAVSIAGFAAAAAQGAVPTVN